MMPSRSLEAPVTRTAAALAISIALATGAATAPASAATYPTGFQEEPIVEGLTRPTAAVWAPGGQMFVAEQDGVLKAVNPDGSTHVVIDIKDKVNSGGDRGFLGIAADSAYGTGPGKNRYFYLLYTAETKQLADLDSKDPMVSQLMRIEIDTNNDLVDDSETVILGTQPPFDGACDPPSNTNQCIPSDADTHSIGSVHSMPDGTLFVGSGDGADYNTVNADTLRSQIDESYAGKILHIDRNGNGLPVHAFCPSDTDLTHVCTKVHSKGFRNPFRFKPNPEGGFNVGDVGQGSLEEIDIVGPAGRNYGWPCYEATHQSSGYDAYQTCVDIYANPSQVTMPDFQYEHVADHAIVAGPTYTADEYPAEYDGRIFFGDYAAGFLKTLRRNAQNQLVEVPFSPDWVGVDLVSAPNGDIAYASFGTGENGTGSIQRIVYAPNNARPVAHAQATPQSSAPVPQTVSFDGSESTDADGDTLTYEWNFDNGGATVDSTEESPSFQYTQAGTYDVVLTVNDGRGQTDTDTIRVDVGNTPPVPSITAPATYTSGDTVILQGSATDEQDDTDGGITNLSWRYVLIHGGHTHGGQNDVAGSTLQLPTDETHGADSHYEATLTATDSGGLTGTTTVRLDPQTTTLRIESLPAGGDVTLTYYSNNPFTTPYEAFEAIGFETTVVARESFSAGGRDYEFERWDDGPTTRSRDVTMPGTPLTLIARYTDVTPDEPPVANASASPQSSPNVPQAVSFDGSGSTDPDGDDLTYEWDFDNGGSTADSTAEKPLFTFTQAGAYDVKLTVDDGRGATDAETIRVDVGTDPPDPPAKPATPAKPKSPAPDRTGPTFAFNAKTALHTRRSRLRGVVADPSGVKRMRVAVGRKYRNGRCAWWSTKRKRLSAPTRRCDRPAWITARLTARGKGAYDWGARLRRRLPAGDYRVALWAEDVRGNVARRLGNGPRLRKR